MNNFIFENDTKVYFGKGCVKEYLSSVLSHYGKNVMLAYGGGAIKKNGIYDEIIEALTAAKKTIVEFSGIMANPTYAKVLEGAALAREKGVDFILGVGGGSVMDCCKAVSLAARDEGDIWNDFWERSGIVDFEPLPLGFVVTVTGTGSECNGGAVITNEERKIKTGRDYPACNAKFAMLDPVYTMTVPLRQTISGGFDILSHIMETYFSEPNEDNVSDNISEALMKSVIHNLREVIKNQKTILPGATLCGRRLWQKTVSSSWANGVTFSVIKWNISLALTRTATMAKDWQCCTQSTIVIFIKTVCRSSFALQKMSGIFPVMV